MDVWEIVELEKKYMTKFQEMFFGEKFIKDIKILENEIKENYDFLIKNYTEKNKFQLAAERIVRQYIYMSGIVETINPSPISSDESFFVNDALINIDVKTTDIVGNSTDVQSGVRISPNQTSIFESGLRGDSDENINFDGYVFEGLQPILKNVNNKIYPNLNYVIDIVYYDDMSNFDLDHINIYSSPNEKVRKYLNINVIQGAKTYKYINKTDIDKGKYNEIFRSKLYDNIPEGIHYKNYGQQKTGIVINPNIPNPVYNSQPITWVIFNKRWTPRICFASSRLLKDKIAKRHDQNSFYYKENNLMWDGWVQKYIGEQNLYLKYNKSKKFGIKLS